MEDRNAPVRTGISFESAHGRKSLRLASLVTASTKIDARTLAARMVNAAPLATGATAWEGVRATGALRENAHANTEPPPRDEQDAVSYIRRALERTVERAFAGARRVAVMTGGGVDSSALLALAVSWAKRDGLRSAFGVAIDFGGHGDDRPHCAALERHLGCEIVRVKPEDAARRFHLFREGVDAAPFTWPGGPFEVEALTRARELGADVCAMGAGADELFDGVPQSLVDVAFGGRPLEAVRRAARLRAFAQPRSPTWSWILRPSLARLLPKAVRVGRRRSAPSSVPTWAGATLRAFLRDSRMRDIEAATRRRDDAEARFDAWRLNPYEEHIQWLKHQEQVAAGLVRRDPYDDPELARAVTQLPPVWLLRGDMRRGLFREAIRGLVPETLRLREDKADFEEGFTRFVDACGGFSGLRPYARARRLADLGLADPDKLAHAFEELAANPLESFGWGTVWPALAVEAFLRSTDGGK